MKLNEVLERNSRILVVILVLVILSPGAYSIVRAAVGGGPDPSKVFLARPPARYQECVEETSYMRVRHMDLLYEIRENAIRHGIRGEVRFRSCWECHGNRVEFCDKCHDAASVVLDCFGCHYFPESPASDLVAESEGDDG